MKKLLLASLFCAGSLTYTAPSHGFMRILMYLIGSQLASDQPRYYTDNQLFGGLVGTVAGSGLSSGYLSYTWRKFMEPVQSDSIVKKALYHTGVLAAPFVIPTALLSPIIDNLQKRHSNPIDVSRLHDIHLCSYLASFFGSYLGHRVAQTYRHSA